MARRAVKWRWPRRRRASELGVDNLQAWALIHLGSALRAHQDGDVLRALRHLALAVECITKLIEQWSGGGAAEAALDDIDVLGEEGER